jgi:hypothetical protein
MMKLPGLDKRLSIVGSTGSGKTQAGVWHLSTKPFDQMPWTVIDYKRDKLIGAIGAREIPVNSKPPREPGIYRVSPIPGDDDQAITDYLWRVWENEGHGVYIDEGYMLGVRNSALNALLTQGRSKLIPMIILSQRPAWLSRFVFSEADFFQIFRLNDRRDYDNIQSMISIDIKRRLPSYHSHYYDVSADRGVVLAPVPDARTIADSIREKLKVKRKAI